jgi:hypothetical protein
MNLTANVERADPHLVVAGEADADVVVAGVEQAFVEGAVVAYAQRAQQAQWQSAVAGAVVEVADVLEPGVPAADVFRAGVVGAEAAEGGDVVGECAILTCCSSHRSSEAPNAQSGIKVIPFGMAMTLRLTEEQDRALTLLAEADGVSKQEAACRAIVDAAARRTHDARIRELSAQGRTRYSDLLDRLSR